MAKGENREHDSGCLNDTSIWMSWELQLLVSVVEGGCSSTGESYGDQVAKSNGEKSLPGLEDLEIVVKIQLLLCEQNLLIS